jgi:hypothetical protein
MDKEYEQDRIDRLNSAVDIIEALTDEDGYTIDEAVSMASKRFNVEPKHIWEKQ